MTYEEIESGQDVRINVLNPKFCANGTVRKKEISQRGGGRVERIYVDTADRGRRICAPSVLERLN